MEEDVQTVLLSHLVGEQLLLLVSSLIVLQAALELGDCQSLDQIKKHLLGLVDGDAEKLGDVRSLRGVLVENLAAGLAGGTEENENVDCVHAFIEGDLEGDVRVLMPVGEGLLGVPEWGT